MSTDFLQVLFITVGSIVSMVVGNPFMFVFLVPLVFWLYYTFHSAYYRVEEYYTHYNASKGPIYNHLAITVSGLFAIRSFGLVEDFKRLFYDISNYTSYKFFAWHSVSRWMQFRNDFAGGVFLVAGVFMAVALMDIVNRTWLATSLALLLIVAVNLVWMLFQFTQNKTFMISCLRMMNYYKLEREAALETDRKFAVEHGTIRFRNVVLEYVPGVKALDRVNFGIKAGEKVGIIGRTGSGKSSIIVSLFRLVEIKEGEILIDGADISTLGLHTLRKQIAVIPQTPFIFTASLRYNLDPFHEYTDDEIWIALKLAHLENKAKSLENQLDAELSPTILSLGQKQLLCLARALLKKSKILVMDEATANVDNETDRKVHDAVKQYFSESTVLVIAHRLNTIIMCNRIIAMEGGKCREKGTPRELLEDEDSYFYSMIMMTGEYAEDLVAKIKGNNYEEDESFNDISLG